MEPAAEARRLNDLGVECAKERRLLEAAEHFRLAAAADANFSLAHRNLGHALSELGDAAGAIAAYERALALEPNSVETLNNLGTIRSKQKDYSRAIQMLARATEVDPNYAPAFNNLGIALASVYRDDQAVGAFRRAIELKPEFAEAENNLALAFIHLGRPEEAIPHCQRALALRPDYADARGNLAMALTDLRRLDEALADYQQALELDPALGDQFRMNRATTLFLKGDYQAAWHDYEYRLKKLENVRITHALERWNGSPLAGRTLLLEAEQGMGDTIQFVRLAAEIKRQHKGTIILAAEPALLPLLKGVAGVDRLVSQKEPRPPFDVWLPLLSVPGVLNYDPRSAQVQIPYLTADRERIERWRARLASCRGVKIGIAWQGNRQNRSDRRRSFPLTTFAPLGKLHGVSLCSLQKGEGAEQLDTLTEFGVTQLGADFDAGGGAFLDTAAVMQCLDLVIAADTSIVHLAGALGVKVWLPLAFVPDWRWGLEGEQTPWYPTMRLFRQDKPRDWAGVFQRITAALREAFPQLRPKQPEEYTLATSGFNRLARTRHGTLLYNRHDAAQGKSLAELGELSEQQIDLFRQCVPRDATVVEAGAAIGAHTAPLARIVGPAGVVHAIEPQRVLFQTLCANVALNSLTNVVCHHAAAGAAPGSTTVPPIDYNQPGNFTAVNLAPGNISAPQPPDSSAGEPVSIITIDSLKLPRCQLVRISQAGLELAALRGASDTIGRCRPILYVHVRRQEDSAPLIAAIQQSGYRMYWHLPPYYQADNYYENPENAFGNFAALHILAIHNSVQTDIQGLKEITSPTADWQPASSAR
jgi:FkbM family methyltransferase